MSTQFLVVSFKLRNEKKESREEENEREEKSSNCFSD
jgi:hypothetical protein